MAGHVHQLPSGNWRVIVQAGGVRRDGVAPDKAAARILGARLLLELGESRRRGAHSIADLISRHLADEASGLSPTTMAEYNRVIRRMPDDLADLDIITVSAPDLTTWYRRLLADGWSIGAVRRLHELLHVAWKRTGIHLGWTKDNPVTSARPPARAPHQIDPPEPATVKRLLDAADDQFRLYLRMSATTGARRSELVALWWSDVDLERCELSITRSHVYTPESGVTVRATKTGRSGHRRIALDPAVVPLLASHLERQAELAEAAELPAPRYVFSNDAGATAWFPDYPTTAFARLRARTGVKGVRLHDLRDDEHPELIRAISVALGWPPDWPTNPPALEVNRWLAELDRRVARLEALRAEVMPLMRETVENVAALMEWRKSTQQRSRTRRSS